jgi:hypothetical protein
VRVVVCVIILPFFPFYITHIRNGTTRSGRVRACSAAKQLLTKQKNQKNSLHHFPPFRPGPPTAARVDSMYPTAA